MLDKFLNIFSSLYFARILWIIFAIISTITGFLCMYINDKVNGTIFFVLSAVYLLLVYMMD